MDLDLTVAEAEFRAAAQEWLTANVPDQHDHHPGGSDEAAARSRQWDRTLFDGGWSVVTWPEQYGGRAASLMQWLLFEDAYHESGAPIRLSQNGISLLGPTLLEYGTEDQKAKHLRPMARGDVIWAQAWSEPGAGSDVASVTSRATKVPGGFRIDGRKTWSSYSPWADMAFGLFRTGEQSARHRALTYLLVPLDAPGVRVEPIRRLDGRPHFGEITFENVFVSDDAVLGAVDQGWKVAMATTGSERGFSLRSPGRILAAARRLESLLHTEGAAVYPELADQVLDARLDAEAFRLHVYQSVSRMRNGGLAAGDASVEKLFWSDLEVRINALALQILSLRSSDDDAMRNWQSSFVAELPGTIWGGTSEIQRNIIAQRVLGLPRSY